jgi:hypothetical protein
VKTVALFFSALAFSAAGLAAQESEPYSGPATFEAIAKDGLKRTQHHKSWIDAYAFEIRRIGLDNDSDLRPAAEIADYVDLVSERLGDVSDLLVLGLRARDDSSKVFAKTFITAALLRFTEKTNNQITKMDRLLKGNVSPELRSSAIGFRNTLLQAVADLEETEQQIRKLGVARKSN